MEPERTVKQKPVVFVLHMNSHDRNVSGIPQICWTKWLDLGTAMKEWRWRPGVKTGMNEV